MEISEETAKKLVALLQTHNNEARSDKIGDLHEKINSTNLEFATMKGCLESVKKDVGEIKDSLKVITNSERHLTPNPACILREKEQVDKMKEEVREYIDEIAKEIFVKTEDEISKSWKRTMWALGIIMLMVTTLIGWCIFLNFETGKMRGENEHITIQLKQISDKTDTIREGGK